MVQKIFVFMIFAALTSSHALGAEQQQSEADALFAGMVSLVTAHDVAIIAGVAPLPLIQYTAETVEFGSNLGLKALRPWLEAPPARTVDPLDAVPQNAQYTSDGCGIEFELLSPQAGYENMFGVANFRDAYFDDRTKTNYRWDTRWGFLQAPRIYHANTSAELTVGTQTSVRKYDQATGQFGDPFLPINSNADNPQMVYLPIGQHGIDWRAGTQLNWISDVAIPGTLLAIGILTEVKNVYGGAKVAKQVKGVGISDAIINEPLDPQGAARLSEGIKRFDNVWERAWRDRQAAKRSKMLREIRRKIGCKFAGSITKVLNKVLDNQIEVLDEYTSATLREAGVLTKKEADLVFAIYRTQKSARKDLGISVIKKAVNCADTANFVADVIATLLKTVGITPYFTKETKVANAGQLITVLDSVPPTINIDPTPLILEATDFGGTRLYRARAEMMAIAEAGSSDNCGRMPDLSVAAPELLPIGQTEVTWTARDKGPNPTDGPEYAPTAIQTIIVEDTQPPLLLAPPSKVIEAIGDVPLGNAAIGSAVAVDLADVQPSITNDAPAVFWLGKRTPVLWTATDKSANSSQASQLITVKTTGSNNAPTANPASAQTLTAEPVDIRLTASDPDELDGRFDPLWFSIDAQPKHGEFIAPLFPFFIEDYRTKPGDGLGDSFDPTAPGGPREFIRKNYCSTDLPREERVPPRNFVHNAKFVHVTDDGMRYVLDEFWACKDFDDNPDTPVRISQWNAAGDFIGQMQLGSTPEDYPLDDTFVMDKDGFLYFSNATERGSSSNELRLQKCNADWLLDPDTDVSQQCAQLVSVDGNSGPTSAIDAGSLRYARVDSERNVIYVADQFSVFVFKMNDTGGAGYIGEVGPKTNGTIVDNWVGLPQSLEVGADGSLYIADPAHHRIHKIAPVTRDNQGGLVLGDYVGWSGRCTSSGNKACDVDKQRSRGYSCTFETNSCAVATADRAGSAQGQFNTPKFIAIDPNDVLYIADFENERIQRLSPDGTFAGEAVSDGSGINKGDRPSFVLGNMGKPASVSVNSSQFFVVDRAEQFVHVFGTLPFKDITDDAVTVTYVSDQDFPNPNDIADDTFAFSVSDGLVDSDPATVTVSVSRNFRPPVALEETIVTDEDTSTGFELPADDPDGIAGKDFLGLDTLTYTVTSEPEHGQLDGTGADRTYTPDPDYYGEDSFTFLVNDGRDDSNEATIRIDVTPVNDPPKVTIDVPEKIAVGFPTLISTSFTDDPSTAYEGKAIWGDGQTDTTGSIVHPEGEDPSIDGVAITEPPSPGIEGQSFADHVYSSPGLLPVVMCVTDSDGLEGCDIGQVEVDHLVSLGLQAIAYDSPLDVDEVTRQEISDGTSFTYEVTVKNGMPSVGPALTAESVVLDAEVPPDLGIINVSISQGSCTADGRSLLCDIGDLAPDATAILTVQVSGPGNLIYDRDQDLTGILTTVSPALESEIEYEVSTTLKADDTDTDGDGMSDAFEAAYGLDPAVDDSSGDADGDGLDNQTEFQLGTSPLNTDTDGDGLSDFDENAGGITSPTNADSDGDGMPDGWEIMNGFDPAWSGDGIDDADNDGLSNADEYAQGNNPLLDDIPPVITVPADIDTVASGRLTNIDLGTATADDAAEGPVAITVDNPGPYPTGVNTVVWYSTDSLGNYAEAIQYVYVVPLATFAVDQSVPEGTTAAARVELNGPAAIYPVSIPYTISGDATNPTDHSATDGELTIDSGTAGQIEFGIVKDANPEPDESIVLTMGALANAVAGEKTSHTIRITETNAAPDVAIRIEQQGRTVTTIAPDGGALTITADVSDNPDDAHGYDWSTSDSAVFDSANSGEQSYVLDPSGLTAGMYNLRVSVTDNGVPVESSTVSTLLKVVGQLPVLNGSDDTDGDGLDDLTEGSADSDGDRVPNYLDNIANSNVISFASDGRAIETNTGLGLRLGETAFGLGQGHAMIAEEDVGTDVEYGYVNGLVDFEITGVDPGGSANVVVPLVFPVSADSIYRKFTAGSWQDLFTGPGDSIASASGSDGACPPPANAAYQPGLGLGDGCLQLTLTDGGLNDSDGLADGVIRDPGGLAVPVAINLEVVPAADQVSAGEGDFVMMRLRLHTDSGDVVLQSLTLEASGTGDDRAIDQVLIVHDVNGDGLRDAGEPVLASGKYLTDNDRLTLSFSEGLEVPFGTTEILVVYQLGSGVN